MCVGIAAISTDYIRKLPNACVEITTSINLFSRTFKSIKFLKILFQTFSSYCTVNTRISG